MTADPRSFAGIRADDGCVSTERIHATDETSSDVANMDENQ
jgi:hypothetical protein